MQKVMRDFSSFFSHLKNNGFEPKTIIDVGVASGTSDLYSWSDAYYILIEALSSYEPNIKKILSSVNGEYHIVAVSDFDGETSFFKNESQLDGSTMVFDNISSDRLVKVPVKRMDTLFRKEQLQSPVLLKTDIQGQDLACIRGLGELIEICEVIIMEVSTFGSWGKGPDFVEVVKTMDSLGWVPYDIIGYLTRTYDNALGQVDIAFVKRDGMFRRHTLWQ